MSLGLIRTVFMILLQVKGSHKDVNMNVSCIFNRACILLSANDYSTKFSTIEVEGAHEV